MKVRVVITVDIPDTGEWTDAFGVTGAAEIRRDIKSYVGNAMQQAGVFGNGEVTADIRWE